MHVRTRVCVVHVHVRVCCACVRVCVVRACVCDCVCVCVPDCVYAVFMEYMGRFMSHRPCYTSQPQTVFLQQ